ncbi:MAG: glutamine synthetase type III, partial [Bacteroidales bacterium]|nr:glutamine synthetase type III [Bacteroidales bacterium]
FLGTQLTELLNKIEKNESLSSILSPLSSNAEEIDIPQIPDLIVDNTDRNRTSPFAFTGNRFEFRAVGSEANCASAMITLNAAVAEALTNFKKRVDEKIAEYSKNAAFSEGSGHTAKFHAIIDVLRDDIKTCKPIRFDGNGYSDEWKAEAARRGLDVETSCPVIFERYLDPESIAMFESLGVMTRKELEARNEVKWETYTKKIQIEARVLGDLSMNHIIPVATAYQSQLLKNVEKMRTIFPAMKADKLSARNLKLIEEIAERTAAIETKVEELVAARKVANKIEDEHQKAIAYHDTIAPMFDIIRRQIDKLELIVDDALWPLPKYRELLFIR